MALATAAFSMAWGPFGLALPDSPETARLFGRVLRRYAVLTVLGSLALGAVAPELVTLVSGREYVTAGTMLPGLLVAAAMAGGFYLLLVAAGISQRGRAVALAAVVGALVQVVATAALLPALGLQAVGVGAIVGQALALVMLVIAVRSSVYGAGGPVVLLCLGGVIGAMLQALNANPEGSLPLRLLIAAIAALLAIRTLLGALRGPLGGKQQK
jgi:O-antigen/teichoic acid export membrane protein